ncbi:MAG: transposase [Bacteriovoracia bacterium]
MQIYFRLGKNERSNLPEIKTLGRILLRWSNEVLNYFKPGLTNARTEGFNRVAKLVQYKAYGYKSFKNYKLRLLSACGNKSF